MVIFYLQLKDLGEDGVRWMINNYQYQFNILMTNVLASKEQPKISSLFHNRQLFNKKEKIVNSISKTINKINHRIKHTNENYLQDKSIKPQDTKSQIFPAFIYSFKEQPCLKHHHKPSLSKPSQTTNQNSFTLYNRSKDSNIHNKTKSSMPFLSENNDISNILAASQELRSEVFKSFCRNIDFLQSTTSCSHQVSIPKILKQIHKKMKLQSGMTTKDDSMDRQSSSNIYKGELDKLLFSLNNQIMLDEAFLTIKQWFNSYQNPTKWANLQQRMSNAGYQLGQLGIKSIFSISSQQQCDFSSILQDYSIQDLINAYLSSQNYWKKNIAQKYDISQLQAQNFIEQEIDIQGNGYISIENLVYFINQKLFTFYRNRDLTLIYKRLKKIHLLRFVDILSTLKKEKLR